MRYWQSDNRTSAAVLPHLRATLKGNLARPHSLSPQAVRKPEGPAMHCHLHRGDWNFHLTNEKKIMMMMTTVITATETTTLKGAILDFWSFQLTSDDNRKILVMIRTFLYAFIACKCHFEFTEEIWICFGLSNLFLTITGKSWS